MTILSSDNVKNLPRCDYKEFLELAKVILGSSIARKKGYIFTIQRTSRSTPDDQKGSCKRALSLATRVNTHIARNENFFQELIQVVEACHKKIVIDIHFAGP